MAKVELLIEPDRGSRNPRSCVVSIAKSLPFAWTRAGRMVHRVRSGMMFFWDGKYTHSAFRAWCGQSLLEKNGLELSADPPRDRPLCATCEGRARGAGQCGSRILAGRVLLFSPRTRSVISQP